MQERKGERLSVDEAIAKYGELIRRVVRRVGGPRVRLVEDDVRQHVVVALWKQLRREQDIESPASYIYRAAVRETVRAVRREMERPWSDDSEPPESATGPRQSDPLQELEAAEQAGTIEQAVESLAADRGRAVRAHLDGWSVEEIMNLNCWTYQKARNLIARGMGDLRAALRSRGIHG